MYIIGYVISIRNGSVLLFSMCGIPGNPQLNRTGVPGCTFPTKFLVYVTTLKN